MNSIVEEVAGERIIWVSGELARTRLGCSRFRLQCLVKAGLLSKRSIPGAFPRYRLDEVERMAEETTEAAMAR